MKQQMQFWMKKTSRSFSQILFPDICLSCGIAVSQQGVICSNCWSKLSFIEKPYCAIKGTPFGLDFGAEMVSADAIANPPDYDVARSATIHANIARQLVTRLKYGDRTDLAVWMADWMIRAGKEFLEDTDVIVPVPLHRGRFFMRRFNQSAELARAIGLKTGIEMDPSILIRKKATKQQVGLNERERTENVRGAFKVPDACRINVTGRTILLIDDVLTTGATVNAAAKALHKAKAAKINVLTFSQLVPQFVEN